MLENETSLILLYSPSRYFLLAPQCCSEASQKWLAPREWLVGKKRRVFPSREVPLSPHLCRSDLLAAYMTLIAEQAPQKWFEGPHSLLLELTSLSSVPFLNRDTKVKSHSKKRGKATELELKPPLHSISLHSGVRNKPPMRSISHVCDCTPWGHWDI